MTNGENNTAHLSITRKTTCNSMLFLYPSYISLTRVLTTWYTVVYYCLSYCVITDVLSICLWLFPILVLLVLLFFHLSRRMGIIVLSISTVPFLIKFVIEESENNGGVGGVIVDIVVVNMVWPYDCVCLSSCDCDCVFSSMVLKYRVILVCFKGWSLDLPSMSICIVSCGEYVLLLLLLFRPPSNLCTNCRHRSPFAANLTSSCRHHIVSCHTCVSLLVVLVFLTAFIKYRMSPAQSVHII